MTREQVPAAAACNLPAAVCAGPELRGAAEGVPEMRLGISSYTYTWAVGVPGSRPPTPLTAFDLLDRAASLGVSVVQICDNLPLDRIGGAEQKALRRRADEMGVQIEVGTRGLASIPAYLRLAEQLRSPILRLVVDSPGHEPSKEEIVRALKTAVRELEAAGVTLAVENHDRFLAEEFAEIVRAVSSPNAGICLDTVNSFGALEGPEVVVETLAPLTVNLHVKDFAVSRVSHQMGFAIEGRPAGQGRLDVPWLLARLREAGRDPNAILELWTPPEQDLAGTLSKEERWARESIGYLRGLIPG